jgi:DNA invertase Pin-like site-specific DNA recombinase
MARTAKRYKKNTEKKIPGIPVCMAAIYARLSVDNDEKKSESIETQVTLIKEFIQKHNENPDKEYEIAVYNIYSDLGKTGTNFDRPGFERMMNDVREGKINCILVKDFSRFGRNYIETGNYLEKILPFMKVRFISVCDNYDSFAPDAKNQELSMNIKNLVNDAYAKDISAKERAAKRIAQKNGEYVGSTAPYGYCVEKINGIYKLMVEPKLQDWNEPS